MNEIYIYICLCAVSCVFMGCVKWNLDKREIVSFQRSYEELDSIGFNMKNGIIQKENGDYIIVGKSSDNQIQINLISEQGDIIQQKNNYGSGEGNVIIENGGNFLVLASSDSNMFVLNIDPTGNLISKDSFKHQISFGLVESIKGLDMIHFMDESLLITGSVRQSIGGERLMLCKVNLNRDLDWINTFDSDVIGYSVLRTNKNQIILLGNKNGEIRIKTLNQDGVIEHQGKIENSTATYAQQAVLLEDSSLYMATTVNERLNIIGFQNDNISNIPIFDSIYNDLSFRIEEVSMTLNRNNNLIIIGDYRLSDSEYGLFLSEIDLSGEILWRQLYPTGDFVSPLVVKQVQDFGFLLFGISNTGLGHRFNLIKTDEEGVKKD